MRKFNCNINGYKGIKIFTIKNKECKELIYYNKNGKTGSGIEKYVYSISGTTDENGNYINYTDYISYGNTYTYKQLKQGTTYSIKVTVYDHSGKTAQLELGQVSTTINKIDIQDVYIDAIYGQDKKGKDNKD